MSKKSMDLFTLEWLLLIGCDEVLAMEADCCRFETVLTVES